jgi:hypothetical protein
MKKSFVNTDLESCSYSRAAIRLKKTHIEMHFKISRENEPFEESRVTMVQSYEAFYGRNLQLFVISDKCL